MTKNNKKLLQSLDFDQLKEIIGATKHSNRSKSYLDDVEVVAKYSNEQLYNFVKSSSRIDWNEKPGFYFALADEICNRLEDSNDYETGIVAIAKKPLKILFHMTNLIKKYYALNETSGKLTSLFTKIILNIVVILIFLPILLLVVAGMTVVAFMVGIYRLSSKTLWVLKNHASKRENNQKPALSELYDEMMIRYCSVRIKNIADGYFRGRISYNKAIKKVDNILKAKMVKKCVEETLEDGEGIQWFYHPSLIVSYYVCYILSEMNHALSHKANINVKLHWVQLASILGLINDALIICKTTLDSNDSNDISSKKFLHYYSSLLIYENKFIEAQNYLLGLEEYYVNVIEKNKYRATLSDIYHLIGIAKRQQKQIKQSIEYYGKSIALLDKLLEINNYNDNIESSLDELLIKQTYFEIQISYSICCFNMGVSYHDLHEYDKARQYYELVILKQRSVNSDPLINILANFGNQFNQVLTEIDENKYDIMKSDKYAKYSCTPLEIHAVGNIGLLLFEQQKYGTAKDKFEEALKKASQIGDLYNQRIWCYHLGMYYEVLGDHGSAYEYHERALEYLEVLRDTFRPIGFFTAFDTLQKTVYLSRLSGWVENKNSWAEIARANYMRKVPHTENL